LDFDFKHTWLAPQTFRAQSVIGTYTLLDVKLEKKLKGSLPLEDWDWQIGVIVGTSGSGKTSIAKKLFPNAYIKDFEYSHACFLDDFPENLSNSEIEKALGSAGFAEPPSWLKSYAVLSQGQKMRVDIARALLLDAPLVVFDEFTSVVDREVAKVGAYAISKAVRRTKKQFIAVTCHFDVMDWLEPDWVFNTDTMEFVKKNDATQKLTSLFINAAYPCGSSFGNITI
jgi:ABC-type ATPase with predicted acetyltransferase domain